MEHYGRYYNRNRSIIYNCYEKIGWHRKIRTLEAYKGGV